MKKKKTIFLADDHELIRQGIRNLIEPDERYEIIGEANDGREALTQIENLNPDMVVLDIAMPRMSGVEIARQLRKFREEIKIIIVSQHQNDEYVEELLRYGVHGYLLKEDAGQELLKAIENVFDGHMHLSPKLTRHVVSHFLGRQPTEEKTKSQFSVLSDREREILKLIAEGIATADIAGKLFISPTTVKTHRANIMKKLKVHSVTELVKYAIKNNIIEL